MAELWYYAQNGQQKNPIPLAQLCQLAATKQLRPTDLVWKPGMPNWTAAGQIQELYSAFQSVNSQPNPSGSYQPVPQQQPSAPGAHPQTGTGTRPHHVNEIAQPHSPHPQTAPRRRPPDYDDEDYRPRRRRKKRKQQGAPVGLIIGIVAGVLFVIFIVVGVIWLVSTSSTPRDSETRNWSLKSKSKVEYHFTFEEGKLVDIRVDSKRGSDVDLFVFDGSKQIASDTSLSSDCHVAFVPKETKRYRVEIWNRHLIDVPSRSGSNHGTLTYKQREVTSKSKTKPVNPAPFVNPNIPGGGVLDRTFSGSIHPRGSKSFDITLLGNRTYTIDARSSTFDTVLFLELNGRVVRQNDDFGNDLNSRIVFTPNATANYRITVRGFSNEDSGPFTVTVRH